MCYASFISVQFIPLYACVYMIYARSCIISTQLKAWHTAGKIFFEWMNMTLDLSFPHHTTGLEEWNGLPGGHTGTRCCYRAPTICKTGLGAETDETQHLAQIAGAPENSWEVRFQASVMGPTSLRPPQAWGLLRRLSVPEMGCHGVTPLYRRSDWSQWHSRTC